MKNLHRSEVREKEREREYQIIINFFLIKFSEAIHRNEKKKTIKQNQENNI